MLSYTQYHGPYILADSETALTSKTQEVEEVLVFLLLLCSRERRKFQVALA